MTPRDTAAARSMDPKMMGLLIAGLAMAGAGAAFIAVNAWVAIALMVAGAITMGASVVLRPTAANRIE